MQSQLSSFPDALESNLNSKIKTQILRSHQNASLIYRLHIAKELIAKFLVETWVCKGTWLYPFTLAVFVILFAIFAFTVNQHGIQILAIGRIEKVLDVGLHMCMTEAISVNHDSLQSVAKIHMVTDLWPFLHETIFYLAEVVTTEF